jgi:hypothetical protein
MSNRTGYNLVLILIWAVTLLPSVYYANKLIQVNRIVDQYLHNKNLIGLPVSKETAIRVSNQVREDFNTDENTFVALDLTNRPFLRRDAGFLLMHKEGFCGEGARVLVNLLDRLGFDATRITLYNKYLESSHTLVSIVIDGQEFYLDSINSADDVNKLLTSRNISSNDFNVLHYTDNISKRRGFIKTNLGIEGEDYNNFFDHYWVYSYESLPYSKLLTKIGFDVRVFNFDRPSHYRSIIAEKPNLIMLIISFGVSICLMVFLHRWRILRTILRMD